jgi:hypothetical protein
MTARSRTGARGGRATARVAVFGLFAAGPVAAITPDAIQHCGGDAACLGQLEAAALRDSAGAVRREGAQLTLQFGLQAAARFVDQPPITNLYLGRLDGVLLHVVRAAQPGRPASWWLVGESGQAPLAVDALPVGGPGGRHFVVAAGQALALYQRSAARWSLQYRYEAAPGLSWAVKSWRADAAAVRLEWIWPEAPAACAGQPAQGQLQLRDGPYGWDLVPEPPRRCGP